MIFKEIELDGLTAVTLGKRVLYFDELPSTNSYIKQNSDALYSGDVIIARSQSSGRGRRGHTWEVPPGQSLSMSVMIRSGCDMKKLSLLPHCTGLSVADAINKFTDIKTFLKWPNDVLMSGKKICGILCETLMAEQEITAIIGIGINISQDKAFFEKNGLVNATSLKLLGIHEVDAFSVAAEVLNCLEKNIDHLFKYGFNAIRQKYIEKCININRTVRVTDSHGQRTGNAVGIDENGNLNVDFGDGRITPVYSGEASVRGAKGYF